MTPAVDRNEIASGSQQFVTVMIGGQLFGVPIELVHEVFVPQQITRVPLAPPVVEGVLNLRGRIVTTINMRELLGFERGGDGGRVAVGIEHRGEAYGLIIDGVGEVLTLDAAQRQPNPANLDRRWAGIARGVHRLAKELMLVLDIDRALTQAGMAAATH